MRPLIDGSLGMAYGVTSTTLLLAAGIAEATASAAVHFSEIGTSLVSGISHHKFGTVDWKTVSILAVPGFVGAFAGATLLTSLSGDAATPWMSGMLLALGIYVIWRFLSLGGVIAAPVAAWLVKILPARALAIAAGGIIILTNSRTIALALGASTATLSTVLVVLAIVLVVLAIVWAGLIAHVVRFERSSRRAEAAQTVSAPRPWNTIMPPPHSSRYGSRPALLCETSLSR